MSAYRPPYPVPGVIWASLPVPALLIDKTGLIAEVNPAGETFLNASLKSLKGQPVLAAGSQYLDHAWVAKDELQEYLPYPALLQLLRDML